MGLSTRMHGGLTSAPAVPRFEDPEASADAIVGHLLPLASAALELPPSTKLTPTTEFGDVMPADRPAQEKMYLRLVYAVKVAFGVEFTWRVAEHAGSVAVLADKIKLGREVLLRPELAAEASVPLNKTD